MLNDYCWPAYVEIGNISNDKLKKIVESLPSLDDKTKWIAQGTRGSYFLPVYGNSPRTGKTKYADYINENLKEIADPLINLCNPSPDVFVLYTPPDAEFPDHNDTGMFEITNYAACWKLRIVLDGDPSCLYFIDSNNKKIFIPADANIYALNGIFPHGMETTTAKLTLAIGWPWRGMNFEWNQFLFNLNKRKIFINSSPTTNHMFESMDFKK